MPGHPDWAGTPGVNKPVNAFNQVGGTVAASSSHQLGPFNIAGQSYAIKIDPQQGAGGTIPFCRVEVQVTDSANFVTEDIFYDLPMDLVMQDCAYALAGPFNGQQITVTIFNSDTVTMTYNVSVNANSTPLAAHTVTTLNMVGVGNGLAVTPNQAARKGLVGTNYRTALGAGQNDSYITPPVPGRISLAVVALAQANPIVVELAPYVSQNAYAGITKGESARVQTDSNGNASLEIPVMRSAYQLLFTNVGAAATDYRWTCIFSTT